MLIRFVVNWRSAIEAVLITRKRSSSLLSNLTVEIDQLASQFGSSSLSALSDVLEPASSSARDITAFLVEMALRFHLDTEALYRVWQPEVFSEVLMEQNGFTDSSVCPAEFDWECLEAEIIASLLLSTTGHDDAVRYIAAIKNNPRVSGLALHAVLMVLSDDAPQAMALFQKAVSRQQHHKAAALSGLPVLFFCLAGIKALPADKAAMQIREALAMLSANDPGDRFVTVAETLLSYTKVVTGDVTAAELSWLYNSGQDNKGASGACPWLDLVRCAVLHWLGETPSVRMLGRLQRHNDQATMAGVFWYVAQTNGLLRRYGKQRDVHAKGLAKKKDDGSGDRGWLESFISPSVDWESQLQKIDQLTSALKSPAPEDTEVASRLVWWVYAGHLGIEIEAREQKKGRNGKWSKGRKLDQFDLLDNYEQMTFLCEHDRQLCRDIERHAGRDAHGRVDITRRKSTVGQDTRIEISNSKLLWTVMAHPRLYRVDKNSGLPPVPCAIEQAQPQLEILQSPLDDSVTMRIQPFPASAKQHSEQWQVEWIKPQLLRVTGFKNGQVDLAAALGEGGLQMPSSAKDRLLESLPALSPMITVFSDVGGKGVRDLIQVDADNKARFELTPDDEHGLHVALTLYPLGEHGPVVLPGQGSTVLLAYINDAMHKTLRDHNAELSTAGTLIEQLSLPAGGKEFSWKIEQQEQSLELIDALQKLGDEIVIIWPLGQQIQISPPLDIDAMHVDIGGNNDWLNIDGELQLDDQNSLHMDALFELMEKSEGRFLPMDDGSVVTLSRELQTRLNNLRSVSNHGRVHPLATGVLKEATRGMVVTGGTDWEHRLQRLQEASQLEPSPPAGLAATLRDYQLHGYQWMIRLAHWGAGACLADDMGLGKTFQSLAVVLERSVNGPTLVVAPTSVCGNWLDETARFAPSLNVMRLGDGCRRTMLAGVGAGDVIVCTYGLLQNEIESIAEVKWATVVADEAQSFKNSTTNRSRAMMQLQADFRLITTGTPIENRLEELWNLFRFINPGLLGSREKFNSRFATPIEDKNDDEARERLKALVHPFMLRRLKREVLTELPPRTEITHMVEFEPEEAAFYESMRRSASEAIRTIDNDNPEQRFQVLAEITRLRQASCHPRLVADNPPVGSAKLRAFIKIVDELRANGHRCLVFSQFVGHLALIREHLEDNDISYQYLDGSTPVKQRQKLVDKFQGGEGELFLISLKAGNSGLNLTAADYVIHMDPWWNPAVEDQASDRAYRMGQTKPVTIYRLVTKGTIEEKIVEMHGQKRELSDGLLDGTDVGVRLSVDDLMGLVDAG